MPEKKPRIAVIGTGGSISIPGRHSLDLFEYGDYGRALEVDELLAMIPEVAELFDVVPVRFRAISSTAIAPTDWLALARRIHEVAEADPLLAGVVVTHGTATLEETAYFLHLTLKVTVPVVVVGAQRPPNGLGTDAGLNLVNAARVAAAPAARGLGVLVVLNDGVSSAREVTKTANFRLDTFRSPEFGVLGHADPDGKVAIYRRPTRLHTIHSEFELGRLADLPRVEVVYSVAGADGRLVEAAVAAGCRGIVAASLAPGLQPPAQRQALAEASRKGVLVVVSNRGGAGRILARGKDVELGFIAGDNLNPQKCRVLAMLALATTGDRGEIRRMFEQY
ncbi:MAG: asparaginase [Proteobacteria bacterium]|nr:asparaginase [Pseudomonadota bacterium]